MRRLALAVAALLAIGVFPLSGAAQGPQPGAIDGVRNFTRVDATVACAGATDVAAIADVARLGYRSIVNLRESSEAGAAIEESRRAAAAAGVRFIHLPLNSAKPDAAVVDAFIDAVTDTANQPVFINCGSANRVGALWMAKRMLVDGWTEARAATEAEAIGLRSATLRTFVTNYVAARRK